jgi:hypothetical protein
LSKPHFFGDSVVEAEAQSFGFGIVFCVDSLLGPGYLVGQDNLSGCRDSGPLIFQASCPLNEPPTAAAIGKSLLHVVQESIHSALRWSSFDRLDAPELH